MEESRTQKSIRNSVYALVAQFVTVILNFGIRTVFIRTLSVAYLGLNGLFTNLLNVLSFAELGFGTAIVYAMYKPIAHRNEAKISAYMNFFAKIYRFVGGIILVVGICLIPYLSFFISDTAEIPANAPDIRLVYFLFLLNTSVSYLFNYKRTLVTATQNGYLDSKNQLQFNLLKCILQLIILITLKSYILYLIVQIACTIAGNIAISVKANKLFPYLSEHKKEKLSREEKKDLGKNVLAMSFHKLGSVVVSGVDNILISKYVGIVAMGCYSNYTLLTATIKTVFAQIMSPITASVGNYVAEKSEEESYRFFYKLFFVNAYAAVFCSSCLMTLSNEFIKLFWGKDYLFTMPVVYLFLFNFFIDRMRQTSQMYIDTNGLFWPIKWKSFIEAIINLVASLFLLIPCKMGIIGIIGGTLISNISTNFWWEPYTVYKYTFRRNLLPYFKVYLGYTISLLISVALSSLIIGWLGEGLVMFVLKCVVAVAVPNLIMILIYYKTEEFKYLAELVKKFASRVHVR